MSFAFCTRNQIFKKIFLKMESKKLDKKKKKSE